MSIESKTYEPKDVESKWYAHWMEKGYFHNDSTAGGDPYCIVIPPPNVTGILHMGHALNNTIQDVLIRWNRMQGKNTVWVPGTDHAGIATQNVVERSLKKEGKHRDDLGREAFVERVWAWREEYGQTITNQLKKLGASCDWDRERFTMDEGLSHAVREVFVRLYNKDLIYRGRYIINWCPRCQTALSDEESEHEETAGNLYHIRYPVVGSHGEYVVVATTRPETMLGDVAVAVNPKDERYRDLVGKKILLPIIEREMVVVEDDFVDPAFGTGVVKVTPAHDPNDFQMGLRHNLDPVNVMNDDGTMNEEAGPYAGMDRFECREKLMADLETDELVEKVDDHHHSVGHCYRCHTIVEPRLSPQWFVKMGPLAKPALAAVQDGRIRFIPDRWNKVYTEWMDNIRDWCISRQIWWGHRIPVFYCNDCSHEWAALEDPAACASCRSVNIRQDEDVLDTWFSSWLWPFSVYGWPKEGEDLKFYYPTNSLVTASEIIFFWVARMVMAGLEFMDDIPFSEVYIHGTVRDDHGLKMSKSLGNSIDPLDIIERYSADALRFSLIMLTATGQDVYLSDEKFELGRNFGTKIWNASRFIQMNDQAGSRTVDLSSFDASGLSADDQHILSQLAATIEACDDNLAKFRLNDYAKALYEFFWHNFCDWYVEYSKSALNGNDAERKEQVLSVMHYVLASGLRLLHPLMPFLTEELWHGLGYAENAETIMLAPWPKAGDIKGLNAAAVEYVESKHTLIRMGRVLKSDLQIAPSIKVDYVVRPSDETAAEQLRGDEASVKQLLRAGSWVIDPDFTPGQAMPSALTPLGTIYMSLEGALDVEAEIKRLTGQQDKLDGHINGVTKKLSNEGFIAKAPAEVVVREKARKLEMVEKRDKLQKMITALSEMASS